MRYHNGVVRLRGYVGEDGKKRFEEWLVELDPIAAAKVAIALTRKERGNFSNVKSVGAGVFEYKIDFGPGYRIYFGEDLEHLVHPARRWDQETPATGYRRREAVLGGVQKTAEGGDSRCH